MVYVKSENQRRVIHVDGLESETLGALIDARNKFLEKRPKREVSMIMHDCATYLFEDLSDAQYFGELLDLKGIPFSYHPAKDYRRVGTKNMDEPGRAMFG